VCGSIADGQDEFQASSKELEDELERELAATEKQQTDLREKIKRLEGEKEDWKVCGHSADICGTKS
jgi:uncharacterized protein HemX